MLCDELAEWDEGGEEGSRGRYICILMLVHVV